MARAPSDWREKLAEQVPGIATEIAIAEAMGAPGGPTTALVKGILTVGAAMVRRVASGADRSKTDAAARDLLARLAIALYDGSSKDVAQLLDQASAVSVGEARDTLEEAPDEPTVRSITCLLAIAQAEGRSRRSRRCLDMLTTCDRHELEAVREWVLRCKEICGEHSQMRLVFLRRPIPSDPGEVFYQAFSTGFTSLIGSLGNVAEMKTARRVDLESSLILKEYNFVSTMTQDEQSFADPKNQNFTFTRDNLLFLGRVLSPE